MSLIAQEGNRFSHVVKHEYEPSLGYTRGVVVANETGARTYAPGTVLGVVTATGKYRIVEATAADGSQNAAAVVLEDKAVAAATDTNVLVLLRGPAIVAKGALTMGASVDTAGERNAVYAALETKGILVNESV